jgi:hypothetical protein
MWACLFCALYFLTNGISMFRDKHPFGSLQVDPHFGIVFGTISLIGVPGFFYMAWQSYRKMKSHGTNSSD